MRVNMHEAKTNLSRLGSPLWSSGEADEVEIARAGTSRSPNRSCPALSRRGHPGYWR